MNKALLKENITIKQLEKEIESLQKKMFIYETLNAEKEIKNRQIKGPFKNGREIIEHVKR